MRAVALVLLAVGCLAVDTPVYDYAFKMNFDELYKTDKGTYEVNGQVFYDPKNNMERVDRVNGRYNAFCNTILPNVSTPCQQITRDDKRWVIFPSKSLCCFCCDSSHGCGILKPDWMKGADYLGTEQIIDTVYDKWNQQGDFGYNYLWVTRDEAKIPRRLDEGGSHITDYNTHSFRNQTVPFPDSTFALPSYCEGECPKESFCAKLRKEYTLTMNTK